MNVQKINPIIIGKHASLDKGPSKRSSQANWIAAGVLSALSLGTAAYLRNGAPSKNRKATPPPKSPSPLAHKDEDASSYSRISDVDSQQCLLKTNRSITPFFSSSLLFTEPFRLNNTCHLSLEGNLKPFSDLTVRHMKPQRFAVHKPSEDSSVFVLMGIVTLATAHLWGQILMETSNPFTYIYKLYIKSTGEHLAANPLINKNKDMGPSLADKMGKDIDDYFGPDDGRTRQYDVHSTPIWWYIKHGFGAYGRLA